MQRRFFFACFRDGNQPRDDHLAVRTMHLVPVALRLDRQFVRDYTSTRKFHSLQRANSFYFRLIGITTVVVVVNSIPREKDSVQVGNVKSKVRFRCGG
jgi:hypothetical protein